MKNVRVPVLIDRTLYEKYKQHAQTAGRRPTAVSEVIRYALNEWISVVENSSDPASDTLDRVLANVIPFPTLRDATGSKTKTVN